MTQRNLLIVQSGGPTPVLNRTLAAIVQEAANDKDCGILGSRSGLAGMTRGDYIDLNGILPAELEQIRTSPGAALGSARIPLPPEVLSAIVRRLAQDHIHKLLLIGGNGTMAAAEKLGAAAVAQGHPLQIIGIPKTIDNDITATDRCPGYASAARFVIQSTRDLAMDVSALPQPVSILETMGRSVGWLAAAAGAAREEAEDAPHLVYVPEIPFDPDQFLTDLDRVVSRVGWAIVVVSEGIRKADGSPVFQMADPAQSDPLHRPLIGGVGQHLAAFASSALRLRCRSEKPGLLGRASTLHAAPQDIADASAVGVAAVQALREEHSGAMVALDPLSPSDATSKHEAQPPRTHLVPLSTVAGVERPIPSAWLPPAADAVNPGFLHYLQPLAGAWTSHRIPARFRTAASGVLS